MDREGICLPTKVALRARTGSHLQEWLFRFEVTIPNQNRHTGESRYPGSLLMGNLE